MFLEEVKTFYIWDNCPFVITEPNSGRVPSCRVPAGPFDDSHWLVQLPALVGKSKGSEVEDVTCPQ